MDRSAKKIGEPTSRPVTRSSQKYFGCVKSNLRYDGVITGSRLPTNGQVLQCMMHKLEEVRKEGTNLTKWQMSEAVYAQLVEFYQKANIPILSEVRVIRKMIVLWEDNQRLRKIPQHRRSSEATMKKIAEMDKRLYSTFPAWPQDAGHLIQNEEDRAFLESMKTDRVASLGAHDGQLAGKVKRRLERDERLQRRHEDLLSQNDNLAAGSSHEVFQDDAEDTDVPEETTGSNAVADDDANEIKTRSHSRSVKTGTSIFIPYDILSRPSIVQMATRLKITPSQQTAFLTALIEETGGDPNNISMSYSTADRARRFGAERIAQELHEEWNPPQLASLHWDSKVMPSLTNPNINEERVTILVGDQKEVKLLGTPQYAKTPNQKAGSLTSDLTVALLEQWNCKDEVVNMVFDTTATNTGHLSGACIRIQKGLNRALLWSACRHHIGETVLTHVFHDLGIEKSSSPNVSMFKWYQAHFQELPQETSQEGKFDITKCPQKGHAFLTELREGAKQTAGSRQAREDYEEFRQLSIAFLESEAPEVKFRRPGAMHKARWMSKVLYSIKMCMSEAQILNIRDNGTPSLEQMTNLRRFVVFVTHVYSQWWMTCQDAFDAPWHDLQLFQRLLKYRELVDDAVGQSALRAFQRHFWYLTSEMVPLALFSDLVPDDQREELAVRLLELKPEIRPEAPSQRHGTGFGRPTFPAAPSAETRLTDLVGVDSWFTLQLLQVDTSFLEVETRSWEMTQAYKSSKVKAQAVNVINDSAERGIKLSTDYLQSARAEASLQNVLQVVEKSRRDVPNLRLPSKRKRKE